jgi:hypothetical protein
MDYSVDDLEEVCTRPEHLVSLYHHMLHALMPDSSVTTVLAGMFSDGLLACRFYVVYSRQFWLLCLSFATVGSIGRTSSFSSLSRSLSLHPAVLLVIALSARLRMLRN